MDRQSVFELQLDHEDALLFSNPEFVIGVREDDAKLARTQDEQLFGVPSTPSNPPRLQSFQAIVCSIHQVLFSFFFYKSNHSVRVHDSLLVSELRDRISEATKRPLTKKDRLYVEDDGLLAAAAGVGAAGAVASGAGGGALAAMAAGGAGQVDDMVLDEHQEARDVVVLGQQVPISFQISLYSLMGIIRYLWSSA